MSQIVKRAGAGLVLVETGVGIDIGVRARWRMVAGEAAVRADRDRHVAAQRIAFRHRHRHVTRDPSEVAPRAVPAACRGGPKGRFGLHPQLLLTSGGYAIISPVAGHAESTRSGNGHTIG